MTMREKALVFILGFWFNGNKIKNSFQDFASISKAGIIDLFVYYIASLDKYLKPFIDIGNKACNCQAFRNV
jgi:hypothetical protein